MKVEVVSLDKVRKNVEVIPDADKVDQLREEIYGDLRKKAKVKGFRPGKVPRSVVHSLYKDYIEDELKRKVVESTMVEALSETKIDPVTEPQIRFLEENTQYGYRIECEVEPEFDLPQYQGIEATAEKVAVTGEEIGNRMESLRQMHAQLVNREEGARAQKGDYVVVKYQGFLNGKPVKDVNSEAYPVDLGSSTLMPEFEAAVLGMETGEEKEFDMAFPADYPTKDVAGKTLLFKVTLKEIKEKKLPELNDEFAKDLSFETVDQLRGEVEKALEREKEDQKEKAITSQIMDILVGKTEIPVPARLLQKQVDGMVQEARSRMKSGTLNDEEEKSLNAALRKEYEPEAEKRVKAGMILAKIAEREGIKVEDEEVQDRLRKIAEDTKRGYDYIKDFYEKYDLMGNLKGTMLNERTIKFLVEKAVIKEKE